VYAINRLQADTGTWYSVVHFHRAGKLYYRRFYEPKHGGKAAARRAAIGWRDEKLAEVKALGILAFCEIKCGNNTSGVSGVHFLRPASQPEGIWQAKLKLGDGTTRNKTFSVRRRGGRKAFGLAIAARRQMLATATDRPFVRDPLAKRFAARHRPSA
jgi:hypothetical protein